MLRIETQELDGALICSLEGRFTGEAAEHVRLLVTHCDSRLRLIVNLTEVMFIDAIGESVLSFVKKLGALFVGETAYASDICERLQLPLLDSGKLSARSSIHKNGKGHQVAGFRRS